jgi:hypothetical protein
MSRVAREVTAVVNVDLQTLAVGVSSDLLLEQLNQLRGSWVSAWLATTGEADLFGYDG